MADSTGHGTARRRIDVHHHVLPPQFQGSTPMPVKVPDTDAQLRAMDEFGIAAAVTSLTPRVLFANPTRRPAVARECNEFQAGLVRDHPERFGAFAVLPLPDIDDALKEIDYALDQLHLDGIGLYSSSEGRFLGDARFDPVFEELNRRKAVVFVHPAHCAAPEELNLHAPDGIIEYVIDTTRAIVNMLWTGTFRRCPDISIIFSHGGGTVPFLARRISGLEHSGTVPDVIGTLRTLYYDVTSAMAPTALRSIQELADPARIVWGTDMPFVHGERLHAEVEEWEAYDGFDPEQRAAVEYRNALRLLPRLAAVARVS